MSSITKFTYQPESISDLTRFIFKLMNGAVASEDWEAHEITIRFVGKKIPKGSHMKNFQITSNQEIKNEIEDRGSSPTE